MLLRDHVLIGSCFFASFAVRTLLSNETSTNGPFRVDRVIIIFFLRYYLLLFRRLKISEFFLLRVRVPLQPLPQGDCGCLPDFERPSPPP